MSKTSIPWALGIELHSGGLELSTGGPTLAATKLAADQALARPEVDKVFIYPPDNAADRRKAKSRRPETWVRERGTDWLLIAASDIVGA